MKTITDYELSKAKTQPLISPVEGLICQGITLLVAPPKIGKSFFSLQMGRAVSRGDPFLGMKTTRGKVLYLALEDSERRIKARQGSDSPSKNLAFAFSCKPLGEGLEDEIRDFHKEHKGLVMVIIDTLQKVRTGPIPKGTTAYAADYGDIGKLSALALDLKIAIVLVHHTRKSDIIRDELDVINGSMGLPAAADTIILMDRKRDESQATISISSRDIEPRKILANFEDAKWNLIAENAEVWKKQQQEDCAREAYEGDPLVSLVRKYAAENPLGVHKPYQSILEEGGLFVQTPELKRRLKALQAPLMQIDKIHLRMGDTGTNNKKGVYISNAVSHAHQTKIGLY